MVMSRTTNGPSLSPLGPTDWHVLVALADEDLHGYGIMKAVRRDSGGAVAVEVGSLYRILSRMMAQGLVDEAGEPGNAPTGTPGRARRYYRLTDEGRTALRQESVRLAGALELARARHLLPRRLK